MSVRGKITAKQAQVLNLVLKHMTSKEIALKLGISPYTVDKHIQTACRTLGVENRREAALFIANDLPPEPLVTQSLGIASEPRSGATTIAQPEISRSQIGNHEPMIREPWDTRGYGSKTLWVLHDASERTRRLVLIVIFSLLILTFGTLFVTVLNSLTEFVRQM
jgi:DNA-binding CsgD family transcriptional regulator